MQLDEVATALDRLAGQVDDAGRRAGEGDPGPLAFAADGPGALFSLGRALHTRWAAALAARTQEAERHAGRLHELAGALRTAAAGYAEVEHGAHRRHGMVS